MWRILGEGWLAGAAGALMARFPVLVGFATLVQSGGEHDPHNIGVFGALGVAGKVTAVAEDGVGIAGQAKRAGAPWFNPAPNPGGEVRTLPEALEIAEKAGVNVDSETFDFKLKSDLPSNVGAEYGFLRDVDPRSPVIIKMDKFFYRLPDGRIMIRVNPNILSSDVNIVGTLAHETHEALSVEAEFINQGKQMRADVLNRLVNSETGTAHAEAWNFADELVRILRGR